MCGALQATTPFSMQIAVRIVFSAQNRYLYLYARWAMAGACAASAAMRPACSRNSAWREMTVKWTNAPCSLYLIHRGEVFEQLDCAACV